MEKEKELIQKVYDDSLFLMESIREAHKNACYSNELLSILLMDLLEKQAAINRTIQKVKDVL